MNKTKTVTGYDGNGYTVGDRVELHPGCDLWMRGARYATVMAIVDTLDDQVRVKLDKMPGRRFSGHAETFRLTMNVNDLREAIEADYVSKPAGSLTRYLRLLATRDSILEFLSAPLPHCACGMIRVGNGDRFLNWQPRCPVTGDKHVVR